MEDLRSRIAQDRKLYPDLNSSRDSSPSIISVSTDASSVVPKNTHKQRKEIIISSDEENDPSPNPRTAQTQPRSAQAAQKAQGHHDVQPFLVRTANAITEKATHVLAKVQGHPIHVPSNNVNYAPKPAYQPAIPGYQPPPRADYKPTWESFNPDLADERGLYDPRKTAAEAEKDLRNLMEGNFNDDNTTEIDTKLAIVDGFRDGVELLPHQVLARVWMKEREEGKKFGGILADDMGLGKTVQTLARIVDGRPKKSDREAGWAAPTLVVCPVALVSQWASEAKKYATGLTVIEHHGPNRATSPEALKRAHIVITSYTIVSSEHATFSPPSKDEGSTTKAKPKPKPKKASSESDSDNFIVDDSDDSADHFGRTLAGKKKGKGKKAGKDALFRVKWWRVVLDEAHNIKNRNTKAALGCCALEAKYRWCLTGTPMQNSVEELYSLIKFLQIRPLNDWGTFNEQIAKPVKNGRSVRAMKRLQVVLKSIMLRRRKDHILNGKPILDLPERRVAIIPCEFNDSERAFYNAIESKMADSLEKIMGEKTKASTYTSVLVLLLRLRQACNHPMLITKDYEEDSDAIQSTPSKNQDGDNEEDDLASMFEQMGVEEAKAKCQVCQTVLSNSNTPPNDNRHCRDCAPLAAKGKYVKDSTLPPDSAKIRMVLKLLREVEERGEGEKTIIFSQFTSMLDLIQPFLDEAEIKYTRYDGSMRKDNREAALNKIKSSLATRVILISFKAGSTGLNLTACNNVILVDLWWNPALEDQAFDRAHRMGQERDVNIFKLTIEETVEQRILELQEKKRELAAAALSGDKLKNMRLGMDDLLALFRPGGREDEED